MICHECAREGRESAAVGECRFCHVGLCKEHEVTSLRGAPVPQYGCEHHPERPFAARDEMPVPKPAVITAA